MECDVCTKKDLKLFPCDSCSSNVCIKCAKFTSSEVKVLELKSGRILKFHCTKCLQLETITLLQKSLEDKTNIINSKDEIILLLKQKVAELEYTKSQNIPPMRSYSEVAAQQNPSHPNTNSIQNNIPSLIIIPKTKQHADTTKKDLQQNIKPADIKIGIKNTRSMKNGGLIVKCNNKNDVDKLRDEIANKLTEYEVQLSKMRKPRIKIVGYEGNLNSDDIEKCLREQNDFIHDVDDLNITYIKQNNKNHTQTIFGECSSTLFAKFCDAKKVYLQWQRIPVYEDIGIQRCFKCQGFFHKNTSCPNNIACVYCGGRHDIRECPKTTKKCNNCMEANSHYGQKYQVDHEASDSLCPSYQYHLRALRSKIDYSGVYGN